MKLVINLLFMLFWSTLFVLHAFTDYVVHGFVVGYSLLIVVFVHVEKFTDEL